MAEETQLERIERKVDAIVDFLEFVAEYFGQMSKNPMFGMIPGVSDGMDAVAKRGRKQVEMARGTRVG